MKCALSQYFNYITQQLYFEANVILEHDIRMNASPFLRQKIGIFKNSAPVPETLPDSY